MKAFELTEEQRNDLYFKNFDGTIKIDGFVFSDYKGNTTMRISNTQEERPKRRTERTIEEHVKFINENNVERVDVFTESIEFLKECPGIKAASVNVPLCVEKEFDFSPLYEMENLEAVDCGAESLAGAPRVNKFFVDFTKMKHIKQIKISLNDFRSGTGFQKVKDLELLRISDCDKEDLREYFCSEKMKYLMIFYSRLRNLDHIETAPNLKWVQLEELKRLEDISALEHIAGSVEALCISGCPKVKDFSVLEKLVNLRHLELTGRNEIPSLSFLNQMPQIQTFLFSMNVLDGDLTPCMKIPYVYCERNRKHYNLKNKDLPRTVDEYYGWGYKFELPSEYMLY